MTRIIRCSECAAVDFDSVHPPFTPLCEVTERNVMRNDWCCWATEAIKAPKEEPMPFELSVSMSSDLHEMQRQVFDRVRELTDSMVKTELEAAGWVNPHHAMLVEAVVDAAENIIVFGQQDKCEMEMAIKLLDERIGDLADYRKERGVTGGGRL